jgi:hypothetical protein
MAKEKDNYVVILTGGPEAHATLGKNNRELD